MYKIVFSPDAENDVQAFHAYLRKKLESERVIVRWTAELRGVIESLQELPERCRLVREVPLAKKKTREIGYASHRVIFRVEGEQVVILRIDHFARKSLRGGGYAG